ncbi:MAG: hypothetical protein CMJ58_14220 [Planctomycetaceae bacterium]|nr:hypothetical protein [Planctomycetaceae bacterium]
MTRNVERKLKDVGLAEMAERAGAVGIDIKASDVLGRGGKKDDIAVKFIIRGFTVATWHLESGRLYLDGRDRFALTPTEALDQVLPHAT